MSPSWKKAGIVVAEHPGPVGRGVQEIIPGSAHLQVDQTDTLKGRKEGPWQEGRGTLTSLSHLFDGLQDTIGDCPILLFSHFHTFTGTVALRVGVQLQQTCSQSGHRLQ